LTNFEGGMTIAQIDTAIENILTTGQSVSVDGITYSAASLSQLREMRATLQRETAKTTRPTIRALSFTSMGYGL